VALDVLAFRRIKSLVRAVELVLCKQVVKVLPKMFVSFAKDQKVIHAVRGLMPDLEPLEVIKDRDGLPANVGKVSAENIAIKAGLGNCASSDDLGNIRRGHQVMLAIGMAKHGVRKQQEHLSDRNVKSVVVAKLKQ